MNGCVFNRKAIREKIRKELPHDVNILISAIAERCEDMTKAQLAMVYLLEPEDRRGEAVRKFKKILQMLETGADNAAGC